MKNTVLALAMAVLAGFTGMATRANAATGDSTTFSLKVSAGAAACLSVNAGGRVTISDLGPVQNMHVEVFNLPPKTEFATFLLQVPKSPFGLAWYQGDIVTNGDGRGVETSPVSSTKRPSFRLRVLLLRRQYFSTTRPAIRPLVPYRFITWESGSQMRLKQAMLVVRTRPPILTVITRPAFRY